MDQNNRLPETPEGSAVPGEETADAGKTVMKPEDRKKRNKRRVIIGFAVCCLLGVVSAVALQNPQWFELPRETAAAHTSMYSDRIVSYSFYPTDYELDVTADEVYMGLDRYVYYKNGNETVAITDGDYAAYGPAVAFFGTYFETVIAGDAETYNTFFSELYYETNDPYVRFAPQMLYNILIEQIAMETQDDGTVIYAFNVSYMIHRNDGTFRNDVESNAARKLYFQLFEDTDGSILIDRITYYVR